jgi:predicted ester cyclase
VKHFFALLHAAFPDIRNTVDAIIVEGDMVAWRSTIQGKQAGPFRGIPATGKSASG